MATRLLPAHTLASIGLAAIGLAAIGLAAIGLAAHGLGASPAAAQTITGTVVDADRGNPLAGASILLLTTTSAAIDSTTTDSTGRFTVAAPARADASGASTELILHVALDGYLTYTEVVVPGGLDAAAGAAGPDTVIERRVEMPLVSLAAARIMHEAIQAEETFRLPLDELCGEPLRPWEAGVLVGVARNRRGMAPIGGAVIRLEALGDSTFRARARVATASGAYWFCNVPAGRVRLIARADGFRVDTSYATVRAGEVGWFDSILRR